MLDRMAELGLRRGEDSLEIYAMCEIPNNVILIDRVRQLFDGFSVGSNDLTQLTLGVDRDSEIVAFDYDERDDGVKEMIRLAVEGCQRNGIHSGLCGQAPSDYPDMAEFLVEIGIDSISLDPDTRDQDDPAGAGDRGTAGEVRRRPSLRRPGWSRSAGVGVLVDGGVEDAGTRLDDLHPERAGCHRVVDALRLEGPRAGARLGDRAEVDGMARDARAVGTSGARETSRSGFWLENSCPAVVVRRADERRRRGEVAALDEAGPRWLPRM